MKNIATIILVLIGLSSSTLFAQNIYNPKADAKADIQKAITMAKTEGKHVLIQIGGNWCPWCIKLHKFIDDNSDVKKAVNDNYVFILVNYSKENKNFEVMKQLEFPNRFGFPVLVVLDANGNRIHTQSTGYLEVDKDYDKKEVISVLKQWSPSALDAKNY